MKLRLIDLGVEVESVISTLVEQRLNQCDWYRVKSCGVKEAAERLNVEEDTIRSWISAGKLAASQVGRVYVIRLSDIEIMLERYRFVVPEKDRRFKLNRHLKKSKYHVQS
jgi:excisionase family DNA binding protein